MIKRPVQPRPTYDEMIAVADRNRVQCLAEGRDDDADNYAHTIEMIKDARHWRNVSGWCTPQNLANWAHDYITIEPKDALMRALIDGARWQALMNVPRMHWMGAAGFKHTSTEYAYDTPTADPTKTYLHFGMEFWTNYRLPKCYVDNETPFCKRLLVAFTDELLAPTQPKSPAPNRNDQDDSNDAAGDAMVDRGTRL